MRRSLDWLRAHPAAADGALAALLVALGLVGLALHDPDPDMRDPDALAMALTVLGGGALACRRRAPVAVLAAAFGLMAVYFSFDYPDNLAWVGSLLATYTVAVHTRRPLSRWVGAGAIVLQIGFMTLGLLSGEAEDLTADVVIANLVTFGTAFVVGENVRNRRERLSELEQRAERAEQEREARAEQAVAAERTRIARELHDVVAHSVSVMVVQAGAARRVLEQDPDAAVEALCSVESVGRQSLTELRRLLGVLRRDDEGSIGTRPQPSVAAVAALVESTREAGLDVELAVEGEARPLPAGVDLSAYRIVQEALTNALKHAGRPARARVRVAYGDDELRLEVLDDGRGALLADGPADGHGLVGMRERVHLFGGSLVTGNRPGGGFAVRARLPLAEPSAVTP